MPDWNIKVWVLTGVLGVMIPALGYLLVREFNRKDKISEDLGVITARFTTSIEELNRCVAALTTAVMEVRGWASERFVPRVEHEKDIDELRADIQRHADRFEKDLDRCSERCPVGRP